MAPERPHSDRRRYLQYAGAAAVTMLAGCSGGGGDGGSGANHEVPHPNDGQVPDAEKNGKSLGGQTRPDEPSQSKDGVDYSHTPSGQQDCGNCSLFVPDANDDGFGACISVKGKIHHCDHCALYSPYNGDGTVPCGN